jgi:hypothetical protein
VAVDGYRYKLNDVLSLASLVVRARLLRSIEILQPKFQIMSCSCQPIVEQSNRGQGSIRSVVARRSQSRYGEGSPLGNQGPYLRRLQRIFLVLSGVCASGHPCDLIKVADSWFAGASKKYASKYAAPIYRAARLAKNRGRPLQLRSDGRIFMRTFVNCISYRRKDSHRTIRRLIFPK